MTGQRERARAFHALHTSDRILVLPNAWDAASARIFELAGAPAVATTSSGLAATLGYPDGERIPCELVVGAVRRITATVDIPVSVDFERGYAAEPRQVAANVQAVIDAGGVGINIEDGRDDPAVLVAKIAAIRALPGARDGGLFVNARTDVFLRGRGPQAELVAETIRRLHAYEAAGADGLADLRRIVGAAPKHLRPGGWLLLEHGYDQAEACRDLLYDAGFGELVFRADIAGLPRIAGGRLLTPDSLSR